MEYRNVQKAYQVVIVDKFFVMTLNVFADCCRGTDYDEKRFKRDMRRATVTDIGNTVELAS
jgi:hypothetical protein